MSAVYLIGTYVRVKGMSNDFKMLSYSFVFGGLVEMILESSEGDRFFIRRRKSQVSDVEDKSIFNADSNDKK